MKIIRSILLNLAIIIFFTGIFIYSDFLPQSKMLRVNGTDIFIDIPKNSSISEIGTKLVEVGLIKNKYSFLLYRFISKEIIFKAGFYKLNLKSSLKDNLNIIQTGKSISKFIYINITFPEGFSNYQVAKRLEAYHICNSTAFLDRLEDLLIEDSFKKKYKLPENIDNLEGFLFPDTYRVKLGEKPDIIISMMLNRFNNICSDKVKTDISKMNKNFYNILIIASLIEKETGINEHKKVSSVIHNRLEKWYMLQIDATILYALGPGAKDITTKNKYIDSPYNTYITYGLPPTPICNPGWKSIEAAIYPDKSTYLYYVSKNNGTHVFTTSYKEHLKYVNIYQRNFKRKKKDGKRK
ncbi:endolytic transglycosylase MltG [Candidatus Dependentiae bacterium]|nr:endolytic transglycosylase MltG [Candidatus Dependentiae bacterium]